MPSGLWRELWILALIALGSLLLGAVTGRYFIVAAFGFGLYIAAHLRQLTRMHRWLLRIRESEAPEAGGLWGEVLNEIRKLQKQALRRQDRLTDMLGRFQSAAAAMPDAVVIVTGDNNIEWANPSAERLLGIRFPRDAGLRLFNLLRDPDFADYFARGEFSEPIEQPSPANSDIALALQVIPFGSRQRLIIARDATRLMRLEQMRRIFVANVSHELRTPLTVLAGYVETLRDTQVLAPVELHKHLATMHEQAGRMQRLVDDLLTLSRLETAPPPRVEETVDVAMLLAGLQEQAEMLSGKQHTIALEADAGLKLRGRREEILSAFSNLINNAVRYTPAGGAIRLHWRADNEGAKFSVTDTGEGIPPEHIPHLTERFYRVDTARSRASGGTGLGLSIVKHVLLRHHARLAIDSRLGQGSTFTCVFPAARVVHAAA